MERRVPVWTVVRFGCNSGISNMWVPSCSTFAAHEDAETAYMKVFNNLLRECCYNEGVDAEEASLMKEEYKWEEIDFGVKAGLCFTAVQDEQAQSWNITGRQIGTYWLPKTLTYTILVMRAWGLPRDLIKLIYKYVSSKPYFDRPEGRHLLQRGEYFKDLKELRLIARG
jgi:hypothetical protein